MKISIIEDEKILASRTAIKLKRNWFSVEIFNSYNDFQKNYSYNADLYIIDISLWDWSWFDIIKWLRENKKSESPIIITSWYNDDEKKIYWLNIWADDYLAKPYSPDELLARIRALIRRSYKITNSSKNIIYKDINYDISRKELTKNWEIIYLTASELKLVELMILNIWKLVEKNKVISSVWWWYNPIDVSDNTINVTISRVRKKLWKEFKFKTLINKWYILEK